MTDPALQSLLDRQAIRDVLSRYCRGLDRMDKEMAYAVWHPDATACYDGIYEGSGHGFVDWVWEAHASMERHSHQITNVLIELDGDRATSEAYVTVVLWTRPDAEGCQQELVGRGRYLDRWERRGRVWAIAHRIHLLDLSSASPLNRAQTSPRASRDERDPSFELIGRG
ncbi:MAG: nuclear transport factor 2 family protein [bacterium]